MNSNGLWAMTAKGELCLRNLIKDQCGSGAESKRQLPITNVIPESANAIGKSYSVSEQFTNLYEVCKTIATQSEIGWRIKFENGTLTLECYEGENKSATVRFDTNYESLANGEFSDSSESFSNAVYVGGKGQNDDRDIYEGENGTPAGFDRFESWDNQSQMTVESEYQAEAVSMLTQYGQTIQMAGNGLAKCPYIYKEQYNVGDWITVAFSGKSAVVQILSVTEHWAWGSYDIQFSFGKPQNNLAEQLQLMLRKIQSASNKESSTDSVRWYTIPTDTTMPKADVTYNTIGFVGACASGGSTFTLYLDNEKTGAKTYHVYFKQLGGGNLTLTTGKAGASNLVMNSGTYVAIIYVDENGNVTMAGATATNAVASGNLQPVTSNAVANIDYIKRGAEITGADLDSLSDTEISIRKVRNYNIGWGDNDGLVIHIPWSTQYAVQIALDEQSNFMAKRIKDNGVWKDWVILYYNVKDDTSTVNITNDITKNLGVAQVNARRVNNMVYLYFYGVYTGQPTNSTQNLISGLPLKYRPSSNVEGLCVLGYSGSQFTTAGRVTISADGNVSLRETAWSNGTQIRAGIIYFI